MRPLWSAVLAVTFIAGASHFARAAVMEDEFQARTGGDIADLCATTAADPMYTAAVNFCQGFAVGSYRVLDEAQKGLARPLFCPAGEPPVRNQAIAEYVAWVRGSPDRSAMQATDSMLGFLQQRYPCPTPAAGKGRTTKKGVKS